MLEDQHVVQNLTDLSTSDRPAVGYFGAHAQQYFPDVVELRQVTADHDREVTVYRRFLGPGYWGIEEARALRSESRCNLTRHFHGCCRHVDHRPTLSRSVIQFRLADGFDLWAAGQRENRDVRSLRDVMQISESILCRWGKISNLHLLFLTQIPQNFSSPAPCVARATASTHIRPVYVSILARIGSPSSNLRLLAIFGGGVLGRVR